MPALGGAGTSFGCLHDASSCLISGWVEAESRQKRRSSLFKNFLIKTINPKDFIKIYVGILVLAMGIIGMIKLKSKSSNYKPKLLTGFAALAGFNKGIGGGGYGPVVMLGQLFSGIYEKTATAIVSLAEGFVSMVGVATFLLISAYGVTIDYVLLPSVFTGGFIAAILSPYMVRVFPNKAWRVIIPVYAICIGIITLVHL